jgi:hypothetical protein
MISGNSIHYSHIVRITLIHSIHGTDYQLGLYRSVYEYSKVECEMYFIGMSLSRVIEKLNNIRGLVPLFVYFN